MASITPTYNSTFPALHATGLTQRRMSSNYQGSSMSPTIHRSLAPPKFPSYLKLTLYGKLAIEQYKYHQRKHEIKPLPNNNGRSSKQRGVNLEEEQLEDLDLRLPTFWNPKDKSKNIEVGSNGLDLSYIGPGKQETHAALARSNFPMRFQCGLFYYEMRVISKGDDGYIGIGFCAATNKLERLPGWDADSWGYHGDDGHSFAGSGTGKTYGPCFSTGDVIGCGVNFADNSAFYTKNGKFLGNAFTNMDLSKSIYAAIGLRTPGEQVTANFGHEPFVYDIAQYVNDQRLRFIHDITTKKPNLTNLSQKLSKEVMDQLILSYLIHHGYTGTAKAVVKNASHVSGQKLFLSPNNDISKVGEKDMEERQLIRSSIVHGKIDEAIQLINAYFPGVLQEEGRGQELQLWLKCGKFIEMMREYCENNKLRRMNIAMDGRKISADIQNNHDKEGTEGRAPSGSIYNGSAANSPIPTVSSPPPPPIRGRRLSYAAIAASLSPSTSTETPSSQHADMMDVDEHLKNDTITDTSSNGLVWSRRSSIPSNTNFLSENTLNGDENAQIATNNEAAQSLKKVMQYGQSLQEEYRHDTREKTRSSLVEIFSLLAYADPYCSPSAYLMNISKRDALATEVNAAILAFQHRPEMPAMERIYRQMILCNKELACEGNGQASLINVDDYCTNDICKHGICADGDYSHFNMDTSP